MIDLTINKEVLSAATKEARNRNVIIPTLKQQANPQTIPDTVKLQLRDVGLWDLNPLNLFRITWHNEPVAKGGGFGAVNYVELPTEITGVETRIIALVGKWFPTGAHKVGAAFGCLVPRLVSGQFNPATQKAVWPSTGNYCRGGAYDSALLGCESIAILPEGMSKERFRWLSQIAGQTIKTPGSESNVKEIFDKCWELQNSGEDLIIFNQFDELGNYLWHYEITGSAMLDVLDKVMGPNDEYRGVALTTGSAGTIACGDHMKLKFPGSKIVASEALQCPTLMQNGFGSHRIEGIGDKHVPWIHNVRNTDMVMAIDDKATLEIIRLFNEPAGKTYLASQGVPETLIQGLPQVAISGVANILSCIKFSKWYELGPNDIVLTVLTDSMEMYQSRLQELSNERGEFTKQDAAVAYHQHLMGTTTDNVEELTYPQRKRIHNLKYFTWVEQQGKTHSALKEQWYDKHYWENISGLADEFDALIDEFNAATGLWPQFAT